MKDGPNVAAIAALIGDPARANMLAALMDGRSLTATELAQQAGVTPQTASTHLARLEEGGLLTTRKQGRHRYFTISGPDVAGALESLMNLAARTGHTRLRTGPRDPALRHARVCYDHLAGEMGVLLLDGLTNQGFVTQKGETIAVTAAGRHFFCDFDLDLERLSAGRRPLCRACLDWSQRRFHLGGALGAALLERFQQRGWIRRDPESRILRFSPQGNAAFLAMVQAEAA